MNTKEMTINVLKDLLIFMLERSLPNRNIVKYLIKDIEDQGLTDDLFTEVQNTVELVSLM